MRERIDRLKHFFEVDLWTIKIKGLPPRKRFYYSQLKIWTISIKEFIDDKCMDKASALTYYSMLSIVPVVAMFFAIAKGFGLDKLLEAELSNYLSGQQEVLDYILPLAQNMLSGSGGDGVVTGLSLVFLIYTVIRLLSNVEVAFNEMWKIKENRKWERKISDYLAVIMLGPLLVILSSSSTVFLSTQVQSFMSEYESLSTITFGLIALIKLAPYLLICILLTLLYIIFPNTRVKIIPALAAGILAGIAYNLIQQGFITFQFAFARYNAIYGALAVLPLLLIWMQLSWFVVLFGAEFAYAIQHVNDWESGSEELKISLNHKKKLILLLLYRIVKRFEDGEGPTKVSELAEKVSVPTKFLNDLCNDLDRSGLISRVEGNDTAYLPSFDIHKMDIHTVLDLYEGEGLGEFDEEKSDIFISIESSLEQIEREIQQSNANRLVKEL